MAGRPVSAFAAVPPASWLSRSIWPVSRFLRTTCQFAVPPRFVARVRNATNFALPEIAASQLSPLPCRPAASVDTRVTAPEFMSMRNTSFAPLLSPLTQLSADEQNAMKPPSADMLGPSAGPDSAWPFGAVVVQVGRNRPFG